MEVVPGLHWVEQIRGAKVYLLFEADRLVVIDTAVPGSAGAIWRALALQGRAPEDVDEIWLTHGDIDHMGSVAALKAASGARVVAHQADVSLIEGRADRQLGPVPFVRFWQPVFHWLSRRTFRYEPTVVDHPVSEGDRLGDWQVVHVPGHTAGSICFYHRERAIAIVGDAINHRMGRLRPPPAMLRPYERQAFDSIRKVAALDVSVCCFGHGPPLTQRTQERLRALAGSCDPRPA